jgi:hypothetical protein
MLIQKSIFMQSWRAFPPRLTHPHPKNQSRCPSVIALADAPGDIREQGMAASTIFVVPR